MHVLLKADEYLDTVLSACLGGRPVQEALDHLPLPVYTADTEGKITYWNRACAEIAGREPQLGRDRWCVTWRIYTTTGQYLPHEQCPMAQAIKEQRPIRDVVTIAERPDGSRVAFRLYPTPLFDHDGTLTGAVNMFVDVTEEQSSVLVEQAGRCRRLAEATYDRETSTALGAMADGFERTARDLRATRNK